MKKIIVAASAVAMAVGAFASPQVYEYKASLKNMYLKEVKVTIGSGQSRDTKWVYMKYQKQTTLKGWLIMDTDGVTSPTIMADRHNPIDGYASASTGFDYGRNRGFLVVINPSAYKVVRHPKILPAILDAKWLDTAFAKQGAATSGPAEGILYVGGDAVKPVRPQFDVLDSVGYSVEREAIPYVPYTSDDGVTNYTGMVAVADYVWTSIYLFAGTNNKDAFYNGPNWFEDGFNGFEFAWDQNLPELLQTGWMTNTSGVVQKKPGLPKEYFHDTWMNGTGVGKWSKGSVTEALCCGAGESFGNDDIVLETLSGNLKGGLFLCTENGIVVQSKNYWWFYGHEWEDQFNTERIFPGTMALFGDAWQNDLWQDGFFEIETTDVIYGTWSIKRATNKFFALKNPIASELNEDEVKVLKAAVLAKLPTDGYSIVTEEEQEGSDDPVEVTTSYTDGKFAYDKWLWASIKGAAKNLLAKANVFNGKEIYAQTVSTHHTEGALPMVTPQFALFYRLVYASDFTITTTTP